MHVLFRRLIPPLALVASTGLALALAPTSASTTAQVDKGLRLYQAQCSACHGENLEGVVGPALKRDGLLAAYNDINGLRQYIQRTMPQGNPDSLTAEEALDLAAFISSRNGVPPDGFAEPAFRTAWRTADAPVANGVARRSWLWGPQGFASAWERYREAPGGLRLVQYFDKTRMEITYIDGRRAAPDFVTNGLLARELVSGQMQVGDSDFEYRGPASSIGVAGDPNDASGPTYGSFQSLLAATGPSTAAVTATISRGGNVTPGGASARGVSYARYFPETGHNVANVFWDFLNSTGPVERSGSTVNGRIFDPWWGPTGLPITEAYWARVTVGGETKDVLVQVFERRVLTYTPSNNEGFQVEMGNVGQHYYRWRYGG